jgi:hypothetical protein
MPQHVAEKENNEQCRKKFLLTTSCVFCMLLLPGSAGLSLADTSSLKGSVDLGTDSKDLRVVTRPELGSMAK